ncbi:OsmC protein [Pyrenophora tritici-repentis]|uniref:OsmC protein n=1 Tax=Pyrenophora tritici-repentis TaxID=45151 RepID=A0A316ZSZ5_9PLEO|nr:OsmC protein [Pyrenophora tritici-repentis]KAI1512664.1 OsmC protein [Pyrenophora tritici-repentis]KAI1665474.1 OsmC protein [Pyrenophora tritici-repentis]KAI1677702.1 OsmC protein [Pyrenophora tritici-repentis]
MFSRTLAPALRQSSRAALPRAIGCRQPQRFITSDGASDEPQKRTSYKRQNQGFNYREVSTIHSARAKVTGGRAAGHVEGENLKVDLAMPGTGEAGKTNPEELFAAGFAACCTFPSPVNVQNLQLNPELMRNNIPINLGRRRIPLGRYHAYRSR